MQVFKEQLLTGIHLTPLADICVSSFEGKKKKKKKLERERAGAAGSPEEPTEHPPDGTGWGKSATSGEELKGRNGNWKNI